VNCAERLVEIFGSQADVARGFQLDRAVVHNWVKIGYVPAALPAGQLAVELVPAKLRPALAAPQSSAMPYSP